MVKRVDYRCDDCDHVQEMVGNHPDELALPCPGCGNTTAHFRVWSAAIIVPARFTRDKINQSMRPRVHTITPNGVVTQEG